MNKIKCVCLVICTQSKVKSIGFKTSENLARVRALVLECAWVLKLYIGVIVYLAHYLENFRYFHINT